MVFAAVLAMASVGGDVYTQGRAGGAGRGGQAPARTQTQWPPKLEAPAPGTVEILPVQGNVYMIAGAGGNITVQVAEQGVLMVDTGTAAMSDKVIAAVQSLGKRASASLHHQHQPSRGLHRRQREDCADR
jgi:hypothetical protein